MPIAIVVPWDPVALAVGTFAAFVVEFLRYTNPDFGPPKNPYKTLEVAGTLIQTNQLNVWAVLTSAVYVLIGGGVTMILAPTDVFQAVAIGAGWQAVFTNIIGTRATD